MSIREIDQGNLDSYIPFERKTLQQLQKEENTLEERITIIGQEVTIATEKLDSVQNSNNTNASIIEKIKIDLNKSKEESTQLKAIAIVLFGCSVFSTIVIYGLSISNYQKS